VPTRRVWRYKPRVEPLTEFQWRFFLSKTVEDFNQLASSTEPGDSAEFFMLFYADSWREIYEAHGAEIENQWRARGWSRKMRKFVMTRFLDRGITLRHDAESERRMNLWREWSAREGWRSENWTDYLHRIEGKK
jgi:hypothetical protein